MAPLQNQRGAGCDAHSAERSQKRAASYARGSLRRSHRVPLVRRLPCRQPVLERTKHQVGGDGQQGRGNGAGENHRIAYHRDAAKNKYA